MCFDQSGTQDDKKIKKEKKDDEEENSGSNFNSQPDRVLKIVRTFRSADGSEYTRVETVRKQGVIEAYLKIRNSKDEQFIKQFATLDEAQKEEMKREKRRIQEQLRRIKRNQERERANGNASDRSYMNGLQNLGGNTSHMSMFDRSGASTPVTNMSNSSNPTPLSNFQSLNSSQMREINPFSTPNQFDSHVKSEHTPSSSKRKKSKLKPDLKLKCGACGNVGHMRTNKACPLYQGGIGGSVGGNVSVGPPPSSMNMAEDPEEEIEKPIHNEDQDLVNVEGTKVKLASKLIKVCLFLKN